MRPCRDSTDVRDLGEIPAESLTALADKVNGSAHLWLVDDPRFLTAHPDSRHIVFKFPDSYPQTHLSALRTALDRPQLAIS